ncbi:MAG: hypothetical protein ABIA66_03430 [Candidatus Omnitrophota bacterium]
MTPFLKVRLLAVIEIVVGLIALVLLFIYGPSYEKEACAFAYAAKMALVLTSLLLVAGIPTLLLYPLGRWIHIVFSPVIAFIFSGLIFLLLIPVFRALHPFVHIHKALFFIMLPLFTVAILFLFINPQVKELFRKG